MDWIVLVRRETKVDKREKKGKKKEKKGKKERDGKLTSVAYASV